MQIYTDACKDSPTDGLNFEIFSCAIFVRNNFPQTNYKWPVGGAVLYCTVLYYTVLYLILNLFSIYSAICTVLSSDTAQATCWKSWRAVRLTQSTLFSYRWNIIIKGANHETLKNRSVPRQDTTVWIKVSVSWAFKYLPAF